MLSKVSYLKCELLPLYRPRDYESVEDLDEGKVDSVVEPEDGRRRQTQRVQTADCE